jgi:hemoglobin/transferrin/lactoferrin receptor protein
MLPINCVLFNKEALYASWLPGSASLLGLRVDFGIDNLTDKAYRRHLSVLDEAG